VAAGAAEKRKASPCPVSEKCGGCVYLAQTYAQQLVKKEEADGNEINKNDLAYAFQETALNVLVNKTEEALKEYPCRSVVLAGGVAANSRLRELMQERFADHDLILPPLKYCTDNALMIACAALHYLKHEKFVDLDAPSMPSMSIED